MSISVTQVPSLNSISPLVGVLESTPSSVEPLRVELYLRSLVILGRKMFPELENRIIGSKHLGITSNLETPDIYTIQILDYGSKNGTTVNGVRIPANVAYNVKNGDRILVGNGGPKRSLELKLTVYPVRSFISQYVRGDPLGQGGFGQVYACRRRKSGQILAAKFIPLSEASLIKGNPYVERECKMADLQHENIVSVFEILNDPIGVCMVMEKAEYGTLEHFIRQHKPISEPIAKSVTLDTTHALTFLHGKGIAHRDIKPCNILIFSLNPLVTKISGFGMAKVQTDILRTIVGTPQFMAPEIRSGRGSYNLLVDSWSLGCVIFNIPLFQAFWGKTLRRRQNHDLRDISKLRPRYSLLPNNVTPDAQTVIAQLLVIEPARRLAVKDLIKTRWLRRTRRHPVTGRV